MAVIETARLLLRELDDADLERLHGFSQDTEVNRFVGGPPAPLEEYVPALRERWGSHLREHGFSQWAVVVRETGEMVGRCGLIVQEVDGAPEVEVGYALGAPHWGRGYAAEAAVASRDWAFRHLDVPHVISIIHPDNAASLAVARRNGMTHWKDTVFRGVHAGVHRITRAEWERLQAAG